jgi:hypothetical protein
MTTATTTGRALVERVDGEIDEGSERWVTAVHEAGHAVTVDALGYRVISCEVHDDDTTGNTHHTVDDSPERAVIAVAGERATRLLLGTGGGSTTDYADAHRCLTGLGLGIDWAETQADHLVRAYRRDILCTARRLYRGRS